MPALDLTADAGEPRRQGWVRKDAGPDVSDRVSLTTSEAQG